jgi:hypothetical protein
MSSFLNIVGFFCGKLVPFCENRFVKNMFDHKFINCFENNCQKTTKIQKIPQKSPLLHIYLKVFKILYFRILNFSKHG